MSQRKTSRRNVRRTRRQRPLCNCESLELRRLLCGLAHEYVIEPPAWSDAIEQASRAQHPGEGGAAADIVWANRGQASDNFSATFGTSANAARVVVDAAIAHWERVITDFNRADGTNTLQVNISINGGGYGGGGAPAATAPADGRPTTGSFTITTGNVTPDPNDSNGWYFDPQPNDWAEYDVPIDAFSGTSTTATGSDFYSVAVSELTHVLGLISDKNNDGGSWNGYRLESSGMAVNTNIMDSTEGGGTFGRFYGFDGPTVDHLMTSYNSGDATNASWGNVIHSAGPGANINWNIVNWQTGAEDVGNALFDAGERTIPSWVMAHILGDAYGYTISEPQTFGTMYANFNQTNGQLNVRGGAGNSSDVIEISAVNVLGINFVTASIDLGTDVPGSRHLPGAGNLPAWSSTFIAPAISGIVVDGGGGQDFIRLESNAGRPTTLGGGAGDDFIDFSFGSRNLSFITGSTHVQGGSGFDQVFVYDNNVAASQTYSITSATFSRPGWAGFSYASDTENHVLTTGTGADTVNIPSTFPAQPVVVASAGGADFANIGNGFNGVQSIEADVQIQNDPSFTTVNINNGPDSTARNATINQFGGGFGVLSGLAPANIFWDNADIQNITVTTGTDADVVNVLRCSERLFLRNSNGVDRYNLGNSSTGMSEIFGSIDIGPNTGFVFNDIYINDAGSTGRNYTWTKSGNGFILGGLPASIYYEATFTLDIQAGGGNDNFTLTAVDDNFINCHGNGGFDTFVLDDRAMPFAFVSNLMTPNVFSRNDGQIFTTVIDTVYDGMESVTFYSHASATTTDVTGVPASIPAGQQATIFLGNNADTVNLYPHDGSGNLTINGNLGIGGGGSVDQLRVLNNSSDPGTYSISNPFGAGTQNLFGVGAAGLGTASIETWQLNGGSGDDTWNINEFTSGIGLAINGGDGNDSVNYGSNTLANVTSMASFNFDGQDGYDIFYLNNQNHAGAWTYTRDLGSIAASSTLGAFYFLTEANNELMRINGGPSAETFNINFSSLGGIILDAGAGLDVLRLAPASLNLEAIQGAVNFAAGGDGGRVEVFDNLDTTGDTFHLDQQFLGGITGDNLFGPGGFLSFNGLVDAGATPGMVINLGSGSDTAYAQPLVGCTTTINFGAQNFDEGDIGDALNLALANAANYVVTGTSSGSVTSDTTGALNWTGVELPLNIDDVAPAALAGEFLVDAPAQAIAFSLSEDVSQYLGVGSVFITNSVTSEQIPFGVMALSYDTGTNVATVTFPGLPDGSLPDGDYHVTLEPTYADAFGNAATDPFEFDTFALAGDANRDRSVNSDDFNILATHFGTSGNVFSDGDFNYDGLVNSDDFNILASNFGVSLGGRSFSASRITISRMERTIDALMHDESSASL